MNELIIILAAILPGIIIGVYIWRKDPQPEPIRLLLKAVVFGIVISFPVIIVESALQIIIFGNGNSPTTLFGTTIDAFVIAALTEESFKLLALWWILSVNRYFDEHIDGIVYAVFVGLGFAMTENIMYLFDNIDNWQSVACMRALFAVPAHYVFAVLMGYYYSLYHFVNHSKGNMVKILLVPVLAHGIYDAILMGVNITPAIGTIGTLIFIWFCYKMQIYAQEKIEEHIENT